ncbi:MAG: hypothetical protein KME11_12425 [Timaviella obliquedivisa GSE-PSE-MK23-08B]|jgi:hypothetical protein|nr:hypothetical protein [Timaviella obliquedivisa GSE-PSE-MK23-08B]
MSHKLATFKINGDRWSEFVDVAAKQHTSASSLLKQFIDQYLSGIDERLDVEPIATPSNINSQIEKALAPIRQEVEELRGKLETLTILEHQPKAQGNKRHSKNKPVAEQSEGEELGDRRLSRGEAYEIARSRGYLGAITSLNRDLRGCLKSQLVGKKALSV